MARKLWELIGAIVVLTIVAVMLIQAVSPYLWMVGIGLALIILIVAGRIMYNKFWHL